MAASMVSDNHVASAEMPKMETSKGLSEKFLDHFWKLAESDAATRLQASVEIIKNVLSTDAPVVVSKVCAYCSPSLNAIRALISIRNRS